MSSLEIPVLEATVTEYKAARLQLFKYRYRADLVTKTVLALAMAALTGVAAQIRVPLPFTPVPITLQTFAVLLTGILLGMRFGGLGQALYVGIGLAGVPWFQGGGAGAAHLLGPTGGYLVGFVVAAAFIGYVIDRYPWARRLPALVVVLCVANFVIIYGLGLPWLYLWLTLISGGSVTLLESLSMGVFPFVPGDLLKLIGVVVIGKAIIPMETYRDDPHAGE